MTIINNQSQETEQVIAPTSCFFIINTNSFEVTFHSPNADFLCKDEDTRPFWKRTPWQAQLKSLFRKHQNEFQLHKVSPEFSLAIESSDNSEPISVKGMFLELPGLPQDSVVLMLSSQLKMAPSQAEFYEGLLFSLPVGIFELDKDWSCIYINSAFSRIFELTEMEVIGQGWTQIFERYQDRLLDVIAQVIDKGHGKCELMITTNQIDKFIEIELTAHTNHRDSMIGITGTAVDVTKIIEPQKHIYKLANFDELTDTYNRAALHRIVENYIDVSRHFKQHINIIFIGFNNFKSVNDIFGHIIGDGVLRQAADRIKKHLRNADVLARLSGDEFVIFMPGTISSEDVETRVNQVVDACSKSYQVEEVEVHASVSAGITTLASSEFKQFRSSAEIIQDLFRQADLALYSAKNSAKQSVERFDSSSASDVLSTFNISQALPAAIANEAFHVNYQPIIDLHHRRVHSVEALIRWNHDALGFIPPDKFIALAEKHGYIAGVTECLLHEIGRDLPALNRAFKLQDKNVRIAINLSGFQLSSAAYFDQLIETMGHIGFKPENITFEITEQVLVQENTKVVERMNQLTHLGYHFSLDDFGSGFSSLSYLTRFPISYLKLDKTFIDSAEGSSRQAALIEGIINIASDLELSVVAEGIESEREKNLLLDLKCDYFQGYYFSKPLMQEDLYDWWKTWQKGS